MSISQKSSINPTNPARPASPGQRLVPVLLSGKKYIRLEIMAKEREMILADFLREVLEVGLMAMKVPRLRADPYTTHDSSDTTHDLD